MSISKRFSEYTPPVGGIKCRTCGILSEVSDEDREAIENALADVAISNSAIATILTSEGFAIGETAIRRHRKNICRSSGI